MFTEEQSQWLKHLSDTEKVSIIPYNPKTEEVFRKIKNELIEILGKVRILHKGSTALKISGQGEIDLYIPIGKRGFNIFVEKLSQCLGAPGSLYVLERARFVKYIDDIKIEIFVINKNNDSWKKSVRFEKYLKNNLKALAEYEGIKNKANGLSIRQYYTLKTIFINKILQF
ncbi:MAG: GrpB family protein [Candidatus Magasanikbacteria bacterium]